MKKNQTKTERSGKQTIKHHQYPSLHDSNPGSKKDIWHFKQQTYYFKIKGINSE